MGTSFFLYMGTQYGLKTNLTLTEYHSQECCNRYHTKLHRYTPQLNVSFFVEYSQDIRTD